MRKTGQFPTVWENPDSRLKEKALQELQTMT